jgi:hypothetical protein
MEKCIIMKILKNRIKPLFIPALLLWITAGIIIFVSTLYYGVYSDYRSMAYILIVIGLSLTLIERYLLERATKKELIGLGLTFLLIILSQLWVIYFLWLNKKMLYFNIRRRISSSFSYGLQRQNNWGCILEEYNWSNY